MTMLMGEGPQIKFLVDGTLKKRLEAALGDQGTNIKEGMTRLIKTFLDLPPEMHPLMLRQVPKALGKDYTEALLAYFASQQQPEGDAEVTFDESANVGHVDTKPKPNVNKRLPPEGRKPPRPEKHGSTLS